MKKVHAKRSWTFFVVLALVLVLGKTPVFAAGISDFDDLKMQWRPQEQYYDYRKYYRDGSLGDKEGCDDFRGPKESS